MGAPGLANGGTCEDQGAEGAEGVGCGEGCPGVPLPNGEGSGEGAAPLPRKKIDFGSQIVELWCKLGAFCTVHLKLV